MIAVLAEQVPHVVGGSVDGEQVTCVPNQLAAWHEVQLAAWVVVGERGTGALAYRGASNSRRRHGELPSMFLLPSTPGIRTAVNSVDALPQQTRITS